MAQELTGDALKAALSKINPGGTVESQQAILAADKSTSSISSSNPRIPPPDQTKINPDGTITQADGRITDQSGQTITPAPTGTQGSDTAFQAAKSSLLPTNVSSQDQFYQDVYSKLQPVIDSINKAEKYAEDQANVASTKSTSARNFAMNAQGLAGSSEADAMAGLTEQERTQAIEAAKVQQASQIADLTKWAIPEAQTEYQAAQSRNDTLSTNYIAQQKTNAKSTIESLPIALTDLQSTDPNTYNNLLQYYDGNENLMKADWIAGHLGQSLDGGKPIQAGTHLIYTFKDPVTGKVFTQNIDTGVPLSADYTIQGNANDGLFLINKSTGETKQVSSGNPYYTANQAATLASKNAMLTSRYGTAVNNITKQLYPTPANNPLNLYSNSLNYTTKLNEAYKLSISPDTVEKGPSDLELIDAAVKINNGGQQITETQVNQLFTSLNIVGKATIEAGKLSGTSALLTDDQRQAIKTLAENNIKAQKENALNATKVIADRGVRAGIPKEMLSTPEDIMALSAASNPTADSGSIINEITTAGGTQNSDGTYSMPDGSIVDPNQ